MPKRGRIGIFNRSYYEETLVVRQIGNSWRSGDCHPNWSQRHLEGTVQDNPGSLTGPIPRASVLVPAVSCPLWPMRGSEAKAKNLDGSGLGSRKEQPAAMKHTNKHIKSPLQDISSPLNWAFRRSGLSGCVPGNRSVIAATVPPPKRL